MSDGRESLISDAARLRLIHGIGLALLRLHRSRLSRRFIDSGADCRLRVGLLLHIESVDLVSGAVLLLSGGSREPLLSRFILLLVAEVVNHDVLVDYLGLCFGIQRWLGDAGVTPMRHLSLVIRCLLERLRCGFWDVAWVH